MRRRPNVIVFMSDDQGAWAQGCAGNVDVRSPAQDRLAAEGTRFSIHPSPARRAASLWENTPRSRSVSTICEAATG